MDFNALASLIAEHGYAFVLMAYFLFKDWKYNEQVLAVLGEVREVLTELKTYHAVEVTGHE